MFEIDGIEVLCHSSIRMCKEKKIYIDPYKIKNNYNDADIILCTHPHYDHFSPEDILKVACEHTMIFVTEDSKNDVLKLGFDEKNIVLVSPYHSYELEDLKIETIPAYNKNKQFHPKEKQWVGYIIDMGEIRYYISGDTDKTKEAASVECDVAFLPIGGTYTMDCFEAADLANKIKPKYVIPIHYGTIVGEIEDGELFASLLDKKIKCKLFIK